MIILKIIFWVVVVVSFLIAFAWFIEQKELHGTWKAIKKLIKHSFITLGILIGALIAILLSIWGYSLAVGWYEGTTEIAKLRYALVCGFFVIIGYIIHLETKIDMLLKRR